MKSVNEEGAVTTYTYDKDDRLLSMTDALGNVTTLEYDSMDRVTKVTDALGNSTTYTYDALGRVTAITDRNGNTQSFTYDAKGQITKVTDKNGNETKYTYDGNGNMLTKTDGDGYVTEYSYNSLDLVSHINYNGAKEVSYQYNAVGELVKMDDWLGTTTFEVDLLGQLKKVTDHKGEVVEYTYDGRGNLISEDKYTRTTTGMDWQNVATYVYDETNRMVEGKNEQGEYSLYTYNGLGVRVARELIMRDNTHGYTDFHKETPSVDAGITRAEVSKESYVIDYTSATFDPLTMDEVGGFNYRYVYGLDKLSVKITSEGTNWWGQNTTTHILKDYYHQDRMGSTTNMTDVYGRVVGRADYNEWGQITYKDALDITSSYRRIYPQLSYTGHDWDDVLGMYYAKARFYSADDKRFVAMDPIKGQITDPLSMVSYLYCVDNPLRYVDPMGTVSEETLNTIGFSLYVGMPHELAFAAIMVGGNFFLAGHQLAQAFTYKWLMNRGYSSVSLEQHMPSSQDRADVMAWRINQYGQETIEIFEIKHRFHPFDEDFAYAETVREGAIKQLGGYYDQMACMINQRNTGEVLVQSLYETQIQYHLFSTQKAEWFINLRQRQGNYIEYWFSYAKKKQKEPQPQLATSPEYAANQYRQHQLSLGLEKEYQRIFTSVTTMVTVTVGIVVGGTVVGLAMSVAPAIAGGIIAAAEGSVAGISAVVTATGELLYKAGQAIAEVLSTPSVSSPALQPAG